MATETTRVSNRVLITSVVAAVEVGFGIIEGIVLPNIFERAKGEGFKVPPKSKIIKTGGTLLVTGILSGLAAEWALNKYKIEDKYRVITIAGVSIAINALEAIIVPNVAGETGLLATGKVEIPTQKAFWSMMGVLSLTALIGGYTSDKIIAGISTPDEEPSTLIASAK